MRPWSWALAVLLPVWPTTALAYRPFDGTDPSVVDVGKLELELSGLSYRRDGAGRTWIGPAARFSYGVAKNWEIVLEGQTEHPPAGPDVLVDDALSLKTVLREGSLQEKTGISVATEVGILAPGVNADHGVGLSWTGIAGQRWSWGSVYLNTTAALTRDHHGEVGLDAIIEGPRRWALRPVGEVAYSREWGGAKEIAGVVGGIWQVKDNLAFDVAVRRGRVDHQPETEVRSGLTWSF